MMLNVTMKREPYWVTIRAETPEELKQMLEQFEEDKQ
jgi:hypothetical protein